MTSDPDPDSGRDPQLPERLRYKPMGAAYQGAMEAVFAIAIATLAGWWIDRRYGTEPFGVLIGATIGFAAFVLRLYRLGAATYDRSGETSADHPSQDGHDEHDEDGGSDADRPGRRS